MRLLYVSALPKDSQTGGANAVNFHIFKELEKHFDCTYQQIMVGEDVFEKYRSKILRKLFHSRGQFSFYSKKRLNAIAKEFSKISEGYDFIFFRGFTPWIHCKSKVPYVAYNDVNFQQFFENTFSYKDFKANDIKRIFQTEKEWLSNAKMAFFESNWGAERCHEQYDISRNKLIGLGRGGSIELPKNDRYEGHLGLLLVANNFFQKGGDITFEVFKRLVVKYPDMNFHIVGGYPGDEVVDYKGVQYHGRLNKESESDLRVLMNLYSKSFLLMHLTREDTNPLVITEAGYFGCPTISVDNFAIPELIKSNQTGIVLPYLPAVELVQNAIESLIENKDHYLDMRRGVWDFSHDNFSWNVIGAHLKKYIHSIFE